jgi:hypothetical protein
MKKLLKVLLAALILIAIAIAVIFYLTSDVTRAADTFFTLVRNGNIQGAYASTAQEFRAATTQPKFEDFLKASAIADYESASWTSRSIRNNVGDLEGSLKTKSGGVIPITIKFVKESGTWKILSMHKPASGIDSDSPALPPDLELTALADHSVLLLGRAINAGDFRPFYSECSKTWQDQTTPEALGKAFKSFLDQKIDLTVAGGIKPEFSEKPVIDKNGTLIVQGFYPVQKSKINFTFKYIQDAGTWKLLGTKVSMKEAAPEERK